MNGTDRPDEGDRAWGAPFSLRRLFWAVLMALVLVLAVRCSARTAAELPHHHARPATTMVTR